LQVRKDKDAGEENRDSCRAAAATLETSARRLAQATLDAKARELDALASQSQGPAPSPTPAPKPVPEAEKTLWSRCKALVAAGWSLTVSAGLNWAYSKVTGAAGKN